MQESQLLQCVEAFSRLLDIRYHLVLGRAGKSAQFSITFDKADCHHLMGIHYLEDRSDRRGRGIIFDDLANPIESREYFASSSFWDAELTDRVICTTNLETILDDNHTVFRFHHKRLQFFSKIKAEYLLDYSHEQPYDGDIPDLYLFIDKRKDSDERYGKSVFAKGTNRDYTEGQERWTVLFKEKEFLSSGNRIILYQHKTYIPPVINI